MPAAAAPLLVAGVSAVSGFPAAMAVPAGSAVSAAMGVPTVAGVSAVVGLLGGLLLQRRLRPARYRLPTEVELPRRPLGWLSPICALACAAIGAGLSGRWPWPVLATGLALVLTLAALSVIDLDVHRLPDAITLPAYPLALLALAGCSAAVGDWAALGRAALAGVVVVLAFVGLSWATPGRAGFGLGDVKLAGVLGLLLGWFGWGNVLLGIYLAFLSGGVCALILLARRRLGRGSHLAFGPFLALGAVAAIALG